jgi:predicted  nucleic acid-binding Zn-ribbon protein
MPELQSVAVSLGQLAALQEVDRARRAKSEHVQALDDEIAQLESELQRRRQATEAIETEVTAVDSRRRELEAQLQDEEGKMTARRMRLNRVRNEKELQLLRHEIEVSKEANQQLEEEVLAVLESLETLTASAKDARDGLTQFEETALAQIQEKKERSRALTAELDAARSDRDELAHRIDAKLLRKYQQIFDRRGGSAVVEVRHGTCQGCHMNLPPQFFIELQRAEDIRLCPNCHRILFRRPDGLDSSDAAG